MSDYLPASPLPIAALRAAPESATYLYADDRTITLHGDRPYRNNNPGNLRYMGRTGADRARADGALGVEASATLDALDPRQRSLLAQTIMVQEGGRSHGYESGPPTLTAPGKHRCPTST